MKTETYIYDSKEFKKMELEKRIETLQAELDKIKAEVSKPVERELLTDYEKIWDNISDYYVNPDVKTIEPLEDKLSAIAVCLEIAHYLNDGWKPDWEDDSQNKWHPSMHWGGELALDFHSGKQHRHRSFVWFKSEALCQHFIDHFSEIWLEAIA